MKPILLDFPLEFETERLYIRCPLPGDGPAVNAAIIESQESLKQWLPFADPLPSLQQSEENVRRAHAQFLLREDLRLHLFHKTTRHFIGSSGLHRINWDAGRFEIGYWLRTSESGKGYMTEAVKGITHFADEYLHAERLEIRCDPRNRQSCRVAERAGFHLEAKLVNEKADQDGSLRDTCIYTKLRMAEGCWGYPAAD